MSVEYTCDGCGKKEKGLWIFTNPHMWFSPDGWFKRSDDMTGPQDACSRKCIEKIAEKTGSTKTVLPL